MLHRRTITRATNFSKPGAEKERKPRPRVNRQGIRSQPILGCYTQWVRTRILGVIPARFASSRFPGKALASLDGRPMIEHVWERASKSQYLSGLVVATD